MTSHYNGVIESAMAAQITSLMTVYSTVYSGTDDRKYQRSASLAFVRWIHRWPVNSPHKGPVTRKMFPFDDVIMTKPSVPLIMHSGLLYLIGKEPVYIYFVIPFPNIPTSHINTDYFRWGHGDKKRFHDIMNPVSYKRPVYGVHSEGYGYDPQTVFLAAVYRDNLPILF